MEVASAGVLDRYANEFRQRASQYPDVWFLAAQADVIGAAQSSGLRRDVVRKHSARLILF